MNSISHYLYYIGLNFSPVLCRCFFQTALRRRKGNGIYIYIYIYIYISYHPTDGGPGSSVGIATGTVRGSNPSGVEIFRTCPDGPWGSPSLLYNEYRVFPSGKERPGRDADPSPPYSAVVM